VNPGVRRSRRCSRCPTDRARRLWNRSRSWTPVCRFRRSGRQPGRARLMKTDIICADVTPRGSRDSGCPPCDTVPKKAGSGSVKWHW
jgi:hypothetical protein